jgi:hypothetical protein
MGKFTRVLAGAAIIACVGVASGHAAGPSTSRPQLATALSSALVERGVFDGPSAKIVKTFCTSNQPGQALCGVQVKTRTTMIVVVYNVLTGKNGTFTWHMTCAIELGDTFPDRCRG